MFDYGMYIRSIEIKDFKNWLEKNGIWYCYTINNYTYDEIPKINIIYEYKDLKKEIVMDISDLNSVDEIQKMIYEVKKYFVNIGD